MMSYDRFCISLLCVFFFYTALIAEESIAGTVTGSVTSLQTKKPVEMVNVAIVNASTNAIVTGSVTDAKGKFTIGEVPAGNYRAKVSILGYQAEVSKPFVIDASHSDVRLPAFALTEAEVNMNEVTITETKTALNTAIDRKVYNVQQDVLSQSGTASDLLQNIPSVQVDIEGNVSLRGSTDVMILINGKKSPLMGANRADVLAQMQASTIERIEVITNPSAKYKPDGTSGIINIVMKKNAAIGFNGTLVGNAGNHNRWNTGASLNYNPGVLNLFGSYSYRQDDRTSLTTDTRTQRDSLGVVTGYFNDNARSTSRPSSQVATLGGEVTFDPANSAGLSGNYHYRGFTRTDVSNKVQRNAVSIVTEQYERTRYDPEYEDEYGMDAFFQHAFAGEDHTLRLEFKASHQPEVEDNHYTNRYAVPAAVVSYDNTLIKQTEGQNEAAVEYSYKIDDENAIEAGYAGKFNKRDMEYLGSFYDPLRSQFVTDTIKTNHFLYHEAMHAVYATYEMGAGAFRLLGGLRAEQAYVKADLVSRNDSTITNEYLYLYPTLHLGYKFSEVAELQLNYSRRARRPEGDDLNPFPEYQDPRNVRAGNPRLRPELIHSVELGCQLQNDNLTVVPSIFYRNAYDRFTSVTELRKDSTLLSTMMNMSTEQSAGFEIVAAGNFAKIVTANASINSFYEQIDASNLGYSGKKSTWSWSGSLNCNVTLPFAMMVQVNSNYRATRLTPQGETRPTFVMNLGLRQDLLDDQLSVVLTVSDLFKTLDRRNKLDAPWLSQLTVNNRDAQIIYLGIAYHFGQPTKKQKEKSLQYDNQL